jgi:hypothetical protein
MAILLTSGLPLCYRAQGLRSRLWHRGHLDVQVDAVQERAADAAHIALDLHRVALAGVAGVAEVAARARVHRRRQQEAGFEQHLIKPVVPDALQRVLNCPGRPETNG